MAANPIPPPGTPSLRLIMPKAVPAGWPPDVVPRQLIESQHINLVKASVNSWPGDVDAQGHNLLGVWGVTAKKVEIVPAAGTSPLVIYNAALSGIDWQIDASGNLVSQSERAVFGPSSLQMTYQAVKYAGIDPNFGGLIVGASKGLNWTSAEDWSLGAVDVRLSRYGPNRLAISEPVAGVMGDLFLGGVYAERGCFLGAAQGFKAVIDGVGNAQLNHVNATNIDALSLTTTNALIDAGGNAQFKNLAVATNVQAEGTIAAKGYVGALGTDSVMRATLWGLYAAFAATGAVRWSQSDTFYDVSDLQLSRAAAGQLMLSNPSAGGAGELLLGPDAGIMRSAAGRIRFYNPAGGTLSLAAIECSDVVANGRITSGPSGFAFNANLGVTATFTAQDGRTVTVRGGIVTGVA